MSAPALTLPGDIEGLLRRCSPVIDRKTGARGVIAGPASVDGVMWWVLWDSPYGKHERLERRHPATLALDLRDATGRAHAAWWLAERLGLDGVPYDGGEAAPVAFSAVWVVAWPGSWFVRVPRWDPNRRFEHLFSAERHLGSEGWTLTDALAHLDSEDPRLLEDGSRWVDAEALRLVVLHVAGRAG